MNEDFFRDFPPLSPCVCGRRHQIQTDVILKKGALQTLPDVLKSHMSGGSVLIVCDENTWNATGRQADSLLTLAGIAHQVIRLPGTRVVPDEQAVGRLAPGREAGCLLAVGSGVIHDICRFTSFQWGVPFVSCPTAASVDGFVSSVACMTFHGEKVTLPAHAPAAVVADTQILSRAPARLTASGVGDMLGKYICLSDWKIAHLVTGEYYCDAVAGLERRALRTLAGALGGLSQGLPDAYEALMRSLLISGIAMQLTGNSRPASGAEHHLSHFLEAVFVKTGQDALHGEKVGMAAVRMAQLYKRAAARDTFVRLLPVHASLSEVSAISPRLAETLQNGMKNNAEIPATQVQAKWAEIRHVLEDLPNEETLATMLRRVGAPTSPAQLGISPRLLELGLAFCPYMRNRVTFYSLLHRKPC